jgi:hypothetical protein
VVLTTHFTFVSYGPSIASDNGKAVAWDGLINTREMKFSNHDNGTFHEHREDLFDKTVLDTTKCVDVILTGHSHRRGIYRLRPTRHGNAIGEVRSRIYDVAEHAGTHGIPPKKADEDNLLVILSDSGGPHPNYNKSDELGGLGRGRPGGTRIKFDTNTAAVNEVAVVPTHFNPRFVVSLDYMDLKSESTFLETNDWRVIQKFETDWFESDDPAAVVTFNLQFNAQVMALGVTVSAVELFHVHYSSRVNKWLRTRFPLARVGMDQTKWTMVRSNHFEAWMFDPSARSTYALIKFDAPVGMTPLHGDYSYADAWTFEAAFEKDTKVWIPGIRKAQMMYKVDRYYKDIRWYPSFDHREKYQPYLIP